MHRYMVLPVKTGISGIFVLPVLQIAIVLLQNHPGYARRLVVRTKY